MKPGGGKRAALAAILLAIALGFGGALANLQPAEARIASPPAQPQPPAAQTNVDYDDDDDNLIDVRTLGQLNAIRYDLNGDGVVASGSDTTAYTAAGTFANRATGMGCASTCAGYELRADLDFDTDDDGNVDASDSPSFPNWSPIGVTTTPYSGEFKGNNRTISNLRITSSSVQNVGLFGRTTGVVSGVGVVDANINVSSLPQFTDVGALSGRHEGTIRSSYSTGSVSGNSTVSPGTLHVGGLVGRVVGGTIAASWSSADVSTTSGEPRGGGLVGQLGFAMNGGSIIASYATGAMTATGGASGTVVRGGGLVGLVLPNASITASYAAGPVSVTSTGGTTHIGGLYGRRHDATATITASYWDTDLTGIADDADSDMPEGRTARQLQQPRPYSGIYSAWNANVDGVAGNDDPWAFGTGMQYPMLKYDGMSLPAQGSLAMGAPDVDTNGETPTVGRMARVCLTTGPVLRAPRTGNPSLPARWVWQRSADTVTWTNIADDGGGTYEYTPVAADANNHLRACVAIRSTDARSRGESMACTRPFPAAQGN